MVDSSVTTESLNRQVKLELSEPKDIQCLNLKTPLKFVTKSYRTPLLMWVLMGFVELCSTLILFPLYEDQYVLIYSQMALFGLTVFLHLWAMCKNPGHLESPKGIEFMDLMKIFDPVLLCTDCEVVRTDRSRHCSVC